MDEIRIDAYNFIAYCLRRGESFDEMAKVGFWRGDAQSRRLTAAELRAWYHAETKRRERG